MNYIEYMQGGGVSGDTIRITLPWYLMAKPFKRIITKGPDNAYMLQFTLKNEKTPTDNNTVSTTKSESAGSTNGDNTDNRNNTSGAPLASLLGFGFNKPTSLGNK